MTMRIIFHIMQKPRIADWNCIRLCKSMQRNKIQQSLLKGSERIRKASKSHPALSDLDSLVNVQFSTIIPNSPTVQLQVDLGRFWRCFPTLTLAMACPWRNRMAEAELHDFAFQSLGGWRSWSWIDNRNPLQSHFEPWHTLTLHGIVHGFKTSQRPGLPRQRRLLTKRGFWLGRTVTRWCQATWCSGNRAQLGPTGHLKNGRNEALGG